MLPFPNEILMLGSVHEDKDYIFQFPCMGIKEGTCPQPFSSKPYRKAPD